LRVVRGSLPIDRLLRTLQCLLTKHKILQTSLIFSNDDNTLKQCITDNHRPFSIVNKQTFKDERELLDIIHETTINPTLFDLSSGRVFHCEILQQQKMANQNHDDEVITDSDILIIAFHHAAFDRTTFEIFFKDLCSTYNNNTPRSENEESFQYIDYAVHERVMDMTSSREFWRLQLEGYNREHRLSLPFDRQHSSSDQLSGLASVVYISFNDANSTSFFDYASSHEVTPFQLGLATFYAFLFKLNFAQNDLCVSCLSANRYRTELQNIIGMFVTTLPYRIQLDPHWSFDELIKHVREKCLSILEHSHYPLQHILNDSQLNSSNISFLGTMFDFITVSLNINQLSFDGASLEQISLQQMSDVTKFDFMLTFIYNPTLDNNRLSFRLVCSRDLFDETIVAKIARRFQYLFEQLFPANLCAIRVGQPITSINKLSLILPEEAKEMQTVVISTQKDIVNEGMQISTSFNELILINK
jgi:hypothetical protein